MASAERSSRRTRLAWLRPSAGAIPQFKDQPHDQPVGRVRPRSATHRARQRSRRRRPRRRRRPSARPRPALAAACAAPAATAPACRVRWRPTACGGVCSTSPSSVVRTRIPVIAIAPTAPTGRRRGACRPGANPRAAVPRPRRPRGSSRPSGQLARGLRRRPTRAAWPRVSALPTRCAAPFDKEQSVQRRVEPRSVPV